MLFAACFLLRVAPDRIGTMGGFWSALYVCHCFVCAFCRTAGLFFSRAWCLAVVTMKGCDDLASSQHGMCVCRYPPHWCVSLQTMGRATGLLVRLLACCSLVCFSSPWRLLVAVFWKSAVSHTPSVAFRSRNCSSSLDVGEKGKKEENKKTLTPAAAAASCGPTRPATGARR